LKGDKDKKTEHGIYQQFSNIDHKGKTKIIFKVKIKIISSVEQTLVEDG